jgi:hypothetical protein
MPRYYLDIRDGEQLSRDDEGTEFASWTPRCTGRPAQRRRLERAG